MGFLFGRQSDICVTYGSRVQRQYCRLAIACLLAWILLAQLSVNVQWDLPWQPVSGLLNINEQNHAVRTFWPAGIPK